ncbi:Frag1/DRAM/Sfk1 [Microdochium trichocladiopsis]|uniref:Frag1/DRAM/Sfk1 n=1 Tax=Microdochium trichocladiopsis TaxID=1682393 RepID=A0A9P8XTL1_9PEZI|nr:Frag1/DRAM/Sfk1 [Microdochium trichocladiopsis]KAH7012163.1 Frag1/DRAM/Sfk1 [Microdochium trichocladiopsis]
MTCWVRQPSHRILQWTLALLPVLSACIGLATLLALFLEWDLRSGRMRYDTMQPNQSIAYISDVAAHRLKPLFIIGSISSSTLFNIAFISQRWRRNGSSDTVLRQRIPTTLAVLLVLSGSIALCCLAGFDIARFPKLHTAFLILFIFGYLSSGLFVCREYFRLGQHRKGVLRISFYIKQFLFIVEMILGIAFIAAQGRSDFDLAAILEWIIAILFYLYIISFSLDLIPGKREDQASDLRG